MLYISRLSVRRNFAVRLIFYNKCGHFFGIQYLCVHGRIKIKFSGYHTYSPLCDCGCAGISDFHIINLQLRLLFGTVSLYQYFNHKSCVIFGLLNTIFCIFFFFISLINNLAHFFFKYTLITLKHLTLLTLIKYFEIWHHKKFSKF